MQRLGDRDLDNAKMLLCDVWMRGLRHAQNNGKTERDRALAVRLLNRYNTNPHTDRDTAIMIFDTLRIRSSGAPSAAAQPCISIHGNLTNATVTATNPNATVTTTKLNAHPGRKRKRTSSGGSVKHPRTPTSPGRGYLKEFTRVFNSFADSKKWPLPGCTHTTDKYRYVEDLLYDSFKDADRECPAHSWVIDTSDEAVMGLFCEEGREMINAQISPLPETEEWFLDAVLQYSHHDKGDELHTYLYSQPPLPQDGDIPPAEKVGRIWIDNTMRCWSRLLRSPDSFTRNHLEGWYTANFWGPAYDQCMGTVPGSYISRGETKSRGTSHRKNTARPTSRGKRQRVGHLYDGLITLHGHEVGVAEHSKTFLSSSSRKWMNDTLKVVKALHDMLHGLQAVLPSRGDAKPQVQGLVTGGWCWQMWRMAIGNGYMCLLVGGKVEVVPSAFEAIGGFLRQWISIWAHRNVLHDFMNSIAAKPGSDVEMRKVLLDQVGIRGTVIPKSVETEPDDSSDSDRE